MNNLDFLNYTSDVIFKMLSEKYKSVTVGNRKITGGSRVRKTTDFDFNTPEFTKVEITSIKVNERKEVLIKTKKHGLFLFW